MQVFSLKPALRYFTAQEIPLPLDALHLLAQKFESLDTPLGKTLHQRHRLQFRFNHPSPLEQRPGLQAFFVLRRALFEIDDNVLEAGQLRRKARSRFLGGPVFFGLVFCAIQVVPHGIEFLERDIDCAALPAGKKQRILAPFDVPLNRRPARGSNAERGSGDMPRDFRVLEGMELFEFLKPESEHVVIQRAGCAAKQPLECFITARHIAVVDRHLAANMTPRLTFDSYHPISDTNVQPASVSSAVQRLIAPSLPAPVQTEKDRANEGHQRAFAGFVGTMEHAEARRERLPGFVVPDAESVDVQALDLHFAVVRY